MDKYWYRLLASSFLAFFLIFSFNTKAYASVNIHADSYDVWIDPATSVVYLQARDRFILIASEVNIPLLTKDGPDLVLTPTGSGGYTIAVAQSIPTGLTQATGLVAQSGDFNGDGYTDIILVPADSNSITSNYGNAIVVFGTSGSAPDTVQAYTQMQGITLAGASVSVQDLDGNGSDELIVSDGSGNQQSVYFTGGTAPISRQLKLPSQVGNTATNFDVTYGGAAEYTVPLAVPTGAAGLSPSITFRYNSQFGNGVMGLGWQLSTGLTRITECYRPTTNIKVKCLNGEELVNIGSNYYRTKIDSDILIQKVSATEYKLYYQNGVTKTLTRKLTLPDVFLETKNQQRGGAEYNITWSVETTNREPLVSKIDYHGNQIQFIYEDRGSADTHTGYWMGAPRNRTKRLASVIARADGQVYRQYDVFYENDGVTNQARVMNIQECGSDGKCLEPLEFGWESSGSAGLGTETPTLLTRAVTNLDNNGKADQLSTGAYYYDQNGDGKSQETVNISSYTWTYKEGGPDGNANYHTGYSVNGLVGFAASPNILTGDIDGDGKDDLVVSGSYHGIGANVTVHQSIGYTTRYVLKYFLSSSSTWLGDDPCGSIASVLDVNGDGTHDVGKRCATGQENVWSYQGTALTLISGSSLPTTGIANGDINGDGLEDIFSDTEYFLSRGDGTFAVPTAWTKGILIDTNSDGKLDIVAREIVGYHNGSPIYPQYLVADIDGDGTSDLIKTQGNASTVRLGLSTRPFINLFTDSQGNTHTIDYAKLTDFNGVYTRDIYDTGVSFGDTQPYQQALTVVKKYSSPNHTVHYKYAGARMHNGEHGYLGFKSITSILEKENEAGTASSLVTTSYLRQDYPFVGKLESVKKRVYVESANTIYPKISYNYHSNSQTLIALYEGSPIGQTTYSSLGRGAPASNTVSADFSGQTNSAFQWSTLALANGVQKPYLDEQTVEHLQLSNNALVKTERTKNFWATSAAISGYGRLLTSTHTTFDKNGSEVARRERLFSYENSGIYGDSSDYLINIETTTSTLIGTPNLVHTVSKEYDYYTSGLVQYEWLNKTDTKGTRTEYAYDTDGNITTTTLTAVSPTGNSDAPRTSTSAYTNNGKYLYTTTNDLGHSTTYENYNVHGLPGRMIDANGVSTYSYYDGLGRLDRTLDHLGNNHYVYRGKCSVISAGCTNNAYSWERSEPAGGPHSYTYWDSQGRRVKTAVQQMNSSNWRVQAWEYDSYGRLFKESIPLEQAHNTPVDFTATGSLPYRQLTYDALNRVTTERLPGLNRTVVTNYADELGIVVTDPIGRVTTTHYNALGQITRKDQADDTYVRFVYDAQGNVTHQYYPKVNSAGLVDASLGENVIVTTYDKYGNRTAMTDPDSGSWSYEYNAFGELTKQTNGRNLDTHFTYDSLGRMATQRDRDTYSVWVYDGEEKGLLDSVSQYDISTVSQADKDALLPSNVLTTSGAVLSYQQALDYHDLSKLPEQTTTQQRTNAGTLKTSVSSTDYDSYGRVQYMTLPTAYETQGTLAAPEIEYVYDTNGYLSQIKERGGNNTVYQQITELDHFGNVEGSTLGGVITESRLYDYYTGWATNLNVSGANNNSVTQSYDNYDAIGLMRERNDATNYGSSGTQSWTDIYTYNDGLKQQLTNVATSYEQTLGAATTNRSDNYSYQYDPLGNIRQKTVNIAGSSQQTNYQYNNTAPHQLSSTSGAVARSYSYDTGGNTLQRTGVTFTYFANNKVSSMTKTSGDSTRFEYGPDQARYLRVDTVGSTTTETLYVGGSYERVSTTDNGATTIEHKFYIGGVALVTQTESTNTEVTQYLIKDYQDSVIAITNSAGALVSRFRYTPFGEQQVVSSGFIGISPLLTTRGYTSHETIEGMDVIHMNGRIYDPVVGRMLQADPVLSAPSLILSYNRYAYVWNNPIYYTDPTGYSPACQCSGGSGGDYSEGWGNESDDGELGDPDHKRGLTAKDIEQQQAQKTAVAEFASASGLDPRVVDAMFDEIIGIVEDTLKEIGMSLVPGAGIIAAAELAINGRYVAAGFAVIGELPFAKVGKIGFAAFKMAGRIAGAFVKAFKKNSKLEKTLRGTQNPVVAKAAAKGRKKHKEYDYGPGFEKEVTLDSGKRADAVNWDTREVVELKPNNPRAKRRGQKQVEGYRDELEEMTGECWSCRVETYD